MRILNVQESVAVFLKKHTAQAHQNLEEIVLPQLESLHTIADYMGLLKKFYGYFKPVEQLIEIQLDETVLPDLQQRRKADLILHDLTFSNTHITNLPVANTLPKITSVHQAFGAMYVLEGSTLGGRGITKMLLKNRDLKLHENQIQFFSGYGAQTGAMWMDFLKTLNHYGNNDEAITEMTTAANETFILFQHWLQTTL